MTMNPEAVSCMIISIALPAPISEMEPQAPDHVQAKAYPKAMMTASNFCEPQQSLAYWGLLRSREIMRVPTRSCSIHPAETTGERPNSMSVPLLEARMTRIQQKGSLPQERSTPQMGIWQQMRQMKRVMAVYSIFYLLLTNRLGLSMEGKRLMAGSRRCRIRIFIQLIIKQYNNVQYSFDRIFDVYQKISRFGYWHYKLDQQIGYLFYQFQGVVGAGLYNFSYRLVQNSHQLKQWLQFRKISSLRIVNQVTTYYYFFTICLCQVCWTLPYLVFYAFRAPKSSFKLYSLFILKLVSQRSVFLLRSGQYFVSQTRLSNNRLLFSKDTMSFSYLVSSLSQFYSAYNSSCIASITTSKVVNFLLRRECMFLHCSGVLAFFRKLERCLYKCMDRRQLIQSGKAWQYARNTISFTFSLVDQFLCQKIDQRISYFGYFSFISFARFIQASQSIYAQLLGAPIVLRSFFFIIKIIQLSHHSSELQLLL